MLHKFKKPVKWEGQEVKEIEDAAAAAEIENAQAVLAE